MADRRDLDERLAPNKGALYELYYVGGGEIPDALKGTYTSDYVAKARIIMYLTSAIAKEKEAQENAKIRKKKHERMEELRERGLA